MKKFKALLAVFAVAVMVSGCATTYPLGTILTQVTLPSMVGSYEGKATKVGKSKCTQLLALVAQGDASIAAACKQGGITKIHHVDWEVDNILGLVATYTCTVYGE
ncbi:MAG: TRL-like family protein [Lentisphaeria bacterium]